MKPSDEKYECLCQGYIYDPANGDESRDIKPGTSFENLPDDWCCPLCGLPKEQFDLVD